MDTRLSARILRGLEAGLGGVCALLLATLLLIVLVSVVARYGFSTGLAGTEELALLLFTALVFLGAPLAQDGALSMRLDFALRALSEPAQRATGIAADAISVAAGLALVFGGVRVAAAIGGHSPALGLPDWPRFALAAAGGGLLVALLALKRLGQGTRERPGEGAGEGPREGRGAALAAALVLGATLHAAGSYGVLAAGLSPSLAFALLAAIGLGLGAPLPHAFIAAAHLAGLFGSPLALDAAVTATVSGLSKFLLVAIPLFLLAGGLLTASGTAERIVRFAAALVGHRRGGLAQAALLSSVLFSGASGSSVANAAFGAKTFQPQLVKNGYPPAEAGAIVASASALDNVIPPSIAFLILAVSANLSVGGLFAWGFFAGGVMALCLAVAIRLATGGHAPLPRAQAGERARAARAAIPAFGLGVVVVLGIRFGIVTTTEAAALAAFYTLALCLAARTGSGSLLAAFRQAAVEAAAIGLLIATAGPFAFLLAVDNVGGLVSSFVSNMGLGPWGVLFVLNLILLAAGLVLDIGAAILILAPILLPLAVAAGIEPVHFGVILVVNLMIGGLTPPVGILVFVVSGVTRVPATALFRPLLPYLAALVAALALLSAGALIV